MARPAFIYILASRRNGTLYIEVTTDIIKRVWQHKHDVQDGFTKKYGVHLLVQLETHDDINNAITREKQMKKWRRKQKLTLIERTNPEWRDLHPELV